MLAYHESPALPPTLSLDELTSEITRLSSELEQLAAMTGTRYPGVKMHTESAWRCLEFAAQSLAGK